MFLEIFVSDSKRSACTTEDNGPVYLLTIIVLIDHPMKNLNHYN